VPAEVKSLLMIQQVVKEGDALLPLFYNFTLEHAIRRVQVNHNGLELNGTHQLLFYADDVNKLSGSVYVVKNRDAFIVVSKKTGLEVSADKNMYSVMCRDKNAERSLNIKNDNRSSERVEQFEYLGKTLTNSIQEEI